MKVWTLPMEWIRLILACTVRASSICMDKGTVGPCARAGLAQPPPAAPDPPACCWWDFWPPGKVIVLMYIFFYRKDILRFFSYNVFFFLKILKYSSLPLSLFQLFKEARKFLVDDSTYSILYQLTALSGFQYRAEHFLTPLVFKPRSPDATYWQWWCPLKMATLKLTKKKTINATIMFVHYV